jgi:hypothetical protein
MIDTKKEKEMDKNMIDLMTPSDWPEGMPPIGNRRKNKRRVRGKFVWSLSGLLAGIILIVVIVAVILAKVAPGTPGNLMVGQAVTDHGLFMQVRSLAFYRDKAAGQDYIMADIKLQNKGTKDIWYVIGDQADGDNVLLIGTKFPGTNNPGGAVIPGNLSISYQGQLLSADGTLHPGATMEGLVFFANVQDGQKASAIEFWRSVPESPFNIFDWTIPQKGIKYVQGSYLLRVLNGVN